MQVKWIQASPVLLGLALCACASKSGGASTIEFDTSPTIRLTVPKRVTESDLLNGFPTVRAEAPAGARGSLVLFGDDDRDLEVDAGETTLRFPMVPVDGGLELPATRITRAELESLGGDKAYRIEIVTPDGKPWSTAHAIDRP
jgi:hypothetical protein